MKNDVFKTMAGIRASAPVVLDDEQFDVSGGCSVTCSESCGGTCSGTCKKTEKDKNETEMN